jgi:hypothetical protein
VLEPPKRDGMDHTVAVALEIRPCRRHRLIDQPAP